MTRKVIESPSFRLEFEFQAPLLQARVIGGADTGLAVSSEYWLRICDEVQACGARQLLVLDAMQGEVMTHEDLERFFEVIAGRGLDQVRLAYVEGRADQVPRIEYAELMARERGYDFRTFGNESDAAVWLRHGMA